MKSPSLVFYKQELCAAAAAKLAVQYHSIGRREEIQAKALFTLRARLDKI
jgi:hypothetical protein